VDHVIQHSADLFIGFEQFLMYFSADIFTCECIVEPHACLGIFTVTICKFGDKMCRISPLSIGLGEIRTHTSRGPSDLIGKRVRLLFRKGLAHFKNFHGQPKRLLVYFGFLKAYGTHFTSKIQRYPHLWQITTKSNSLQSSAHCPLPCCTPYTSLQVANCQLPIGSDKRLGKFATSLRKIDHLFSRRLLG